MIAEIVSNGMLSLPSSLATVGIAPGIILIVFLGSFATYTSYLLVNFKLRHPEVHNMGDAGFILFGPIGREVLAFGTVVFAIFATGGQLLAGQIALASLSDEKLCNMVYTGIFAAGTLALSWPRTMDKLGWISVASVVSILVAGIVGMAGAGIAPVEGRVVDVVKSSDFYTAFFSITNPVFAYAVSRTSSVLWKNDTDRDTQGHFMFFILMSEMKRPEDAMKAGMYQVWSSNAHKPLTHSPKAYTLQTFATTFYAVFAAITYVYLGNSVQSPSFSSLAPVWQKAAYGIALPNFLMAGALYAHTAAKLFFVRIFRHSRHLHSHTVLGWSVWLALVLLVNVAAFVLAVGVPVFNYLIGLAASLFAAWYTYGIAGMFFLHDVWADEGGSRGWKRRSGQSLVAVFTVAVGAFICVAGCYVSIKGIVEAYASGQVPGAFVC